MRWVDRPSAPLDQLLPTSIGHVHIAHKQGAVPGPRPQQKAACGVSAECLACIQHNGLMVNTVTRRIKSSSGNPQFSQYSIIIADQKDILLPQDKGRKTQCPPAVEAAF